MRRVALDVPHGMTLEKAAEILSVYVLGGLAYENPVGIAGVRPHGPKPCKGNDAKWWLDTSEEFWVEQDAKFPREANICSANESGYAVLLAMGTLFAAKQRRS